MSENKKPQNDTETILMALDQISQTIDVMTSVVGRLRTYLQQQESTTQADKSGEQTAVDLQSSRTVH
jgi:argininosuccinate lyase